MRELGRQCLTIVALEGNIAVPANPLPAAMVGPAVGAGAAGPAHDWVAVNANRIQLEAALQALVDHGAQTRADRLGKHLFIAGLRSYIRDELMKNPPVGSLYEAYQTAHNIEKCLTDPKTMRQASSIGRIKNVAARGTTTNNVPAQENDVAALNRSNRGRGRGRGGFSRGRGRGSYQSANRSDKICYHCGKKGHFQNDCYSKQRGEPKVFVQAPVDQDELEYENHEPENQEEEEETQEEGAVLFNMSSVDLNFH